MSAVLGVSAHYHDSAAALVVDGRVVAAQQEERLSRIKNDASLPRRAIRAVLEIGGIDAQALDAVVFYEKPYTKLERVLVGTMQAYPRALRQFPRALGSQLGDKIWIIDALADFLDLPRERIETVEHHASHAASAFYPSPFQRAAVVVVDAVGEKACTSIWKAGPEGLKSIMQIDYPHSLGLFYAAVTAYLGFEVNEGEYKVMGLAAFGKPSRRDAMAKLLRVNVDGSYELGLDFFDRFTRTELGYGHAMSVLLGVPRLAGERWDLARQDDQSYADIARSAQDALEDALVGIAKAARERTGADALCLAGGVALNAVANRRIAREAGFAQVFVQPAAGDAGGALGAALIGAMARGDPRTQPIRDYGLGVSVRNAPVMTHAKALGLHAVTCDPVTALADALQAGEIVALVQGRNEWGPRALGHRSIIARADDADVRERLNRAVKKREPFRPFAPVVIADDATRYFDGAPNLMTPFMTTVCDVRDPVRLPAVTHVDGTARLQTVTPDTTLGALLDL
ncbi:MAG: carbamoyl transferase, partial [Clostridia bacterium]|nr:carbamoyl transferase [Deltaproteobacteria bacterium]